MENMCYKILIVEDIEMAQKLAAMIFKGSGCEVHTASNAMQAIEHVQKNRYHLILMDLGLPDRSGFEVTQEIRKMERGDDMLIIALTAHATEEDRESCLMAGMQDAITKPLSLEKAKDILEKYADTLKKWTM